MEENALKINDDVLCSLMALDKSKVYLFILSAGDAHKDKIAVTLRQLKACLDEAGITGVYTVKTDDGYGDITAIELQRYLEDNA